MADDGGQSLKLSAQSVQDALRTKGMDTRVIEFSASTRTAQEAAESIGCTVEQIVKSLIFKTKRSNKAVLVLVSGPTRVNEKKISELVGDVIEKATADFVREVTGFAIGGVPPVGHRTKIEYVFIDSNLTNLSEVWAAAGTPNAVFMIKGSVLVLLTGGTIIAMD